MSSSTGGHGVQRPRPKDLLPDRRRGRVLLRLDTDAATFFSRAAAVLSECDEWRNIRPGHTLGEALFADYAGSEDFHPALGDLRIDFIADVRVGLEPQVVAIHLSSSRYADFDYDSYVRAIRLLGPAIKSYNRKHGTGLRLRVPSRESLEPRLPPGAREFLERALVDMPHKPIDVRLEYFYAFVWYMHAHHVQLEAVDIGRILECRGLEPWLVSDLVQTYRHGRNLIYMQHCWNTVQPGPCAPESWFRRARPGSRQLAD